MPPTSVMIDGAHILSKTATGIGSYARTLAGTLKSSGCAVSVLYGRRAKPRRGELPISFAARVFGSDPPERGWKRLLVNGRAMADATIGRGRRARAFPVATDGVDLSSFDPALPPSDQVLNADGIFERAHFLFAAKRRFVRLEVPRGCKVAHWTAPVAIRAQGIANIYTVHDLIPLQFPHFVIDKGGHAVDLHAAIAQQADLIITVSETSKRHIVELLRVPESRISVTYQPVPDLPGLARSDAERLVESIYGVRPGAYALHLGAIEPKKNLKRLVEAFLLANTRIPLLTVGPLGWLYEDDVALMESIAGSGAGRGLLRRLGYLPRPHVTALLQCARFLVFPSLYEGFGLPVLEAMQLGVPVLTSSAGPLPEVAGDAALLVPPLDVSAMAEQIRRLANDRDLCAELSRRGPAQAAKFSAEHYRQRLADAYRKVGVEIGCADVVRAARPREPERRLVSPQGVAYPPAA